MRKFTLLLLAIIIGLPFMATADSRVNLTPAPKQITVGDGTLVLPENFTIATGLLPDSLVNEATKFARHFAGVTGYTVDVKADAADALITMSLYNGSENLGCEGYTLDITADGIAISATCSNGFYYAFQSIKKMLTMGSAYSVTASSFTPAITLAGSIFFMLWNA